MVKDGWYICPHCGKRLVKVDEAAKSNGIYIKCKERNCGKEVEIKI